MQQELIDLQPVLRESQAATAKLMVDIEEKLPGVEATKKRVGADADAAQIEADAVALKKAGVEKDLEEFESRDLVDFDAAVSSAGV